MHVIMHSLLSSTHLPYQHTQAPCMQACSCVKQPAGLASNICKPQNHTPIKDVKFRCHTDPYNCSSTAEAHKPCFDAPYAPLLQLTVTQTQSRRNLAMHQILYPIMQPLQHALTHSQKSQSACHNLSYRLSPRPFVTGTTANTLQKSHVQEHWLATNHADSRTACSQAMLSDYPSSPIAGRILAPSQPQCDCNVGSLLEPCLSYCGLPCLLSAHKLPALVVEPDAARRHIWT